MFLETMSNGLKISKAMTKKTEKRLNRKLDSFFNLMPNQFNLFKSLKYTCL